MAGKVATIGTVVVTTAVAGVGLYYFYARSVRQALQNKTVGELLLLLDHENCHIRDIAIVRSKIRKLVSGGVNKLQIVTDFDRTLTKCFVDGQLGHASYGVIDDSSYIADSIIQELRTLKEKYFPIEMSTVLTEEEKIPYMIEWWISAINIAAKAGVQKRLLPAMVRESRAVLRDGSDQFFHLIKENNIPILIMSAGIGDIVEEILRQQAEISSSIKVVANYYTYDKDNIVTGIKDDLIHTFNKNEVSKKQVEYFNHFKERNNVILMGDTLGDPGMADGVQNANTVLKIGFLNKDIDQSLPRYMSDYDIVLTNDATMDLVNVFLQQLCLQR